jgi:hypothetical protein
MITRKSDNGDELEACFGGNTFKLSQQYNTLY